MKLSFVIDKRYDKQFVRDKKTLLYLEEQYKKIQQDLKISQKNYQNSWNEINDDFTKYIEKKTGYKWFYDSYKCVVSVVHKGISNWGEAPIIIRGWKEDPLKMRRVTAHELILSHYFEIYKRNYSKEELTNNQVWALAEIAAWALTSLTPDVKKFWPWNTEYYTNHNYPQLVDMQNELKDTFLNMNNFDEYIKAGIALVKKYPKIGPSNN